MSENEERSDGPSPNGDGGYLTGYFLISEIGLMDPNFYRSVVLMITHDDKGAFGLVVNRPSKLTLGDLVEGMGKSPAASIPVYVGGPLQQDFLFVLHTEFAAGSSGDNEKRPVEGVVFEPMTQSAVDYLKEKWSSLPDGKRPTVRLYAGYSGWGPGQLEGELQSEAWVVLPATQEIIFHPNPAEGWADALGKKGPLYQIILQTGFKPSMN